MGMWVVHSTDGTDYRVGHWKDGVWHPGSFGDAIREQGLLNEPGSYIKWIEEEA